MVVDFRYFDDERLLQRRRLGDVCRAIQSFSRCESCRKPHVWRLYLKWFHAIHSPLSLLDKRVTPGMLKRPPWRPEQNARIPRFIDRFLEMEDDWN